MGPSAHARSPQCAGGFSKRSGVEDPNPYKEDVMRFWERVVGFSYAALLLVGLSAQAQMIDNTQAPNTAKAGINKSLLDEIGAGRGDVMTASSSVYIINRDPFRSIRRGRQLFQRKFTRLQGQGANEKDGVGDINNDIAIGAGLSDSCALCHGRPGDRRARAATW
jgi:hypothetical protein